MAKLKGIFEPYFVKYEVFKMNFNATVIEDDFQLFL